MLFEQPQGWFEVGDPGKPAPWGGGVGIAAEIVAALIEDAATLKRLGRREGRALLFPENLGFDPIPIDAEGVQILGKVIAVIRRL